MNALQRHRMHPIVLATAVGAVFALAHGTASAIEPYDKAVHSDPRTLAPGTFAVDPDSPTTMPRSMGPDPRDADIGGDALPSRSGVTAPPAVPQAGPDNGATADAQSGATADVRALATGKNGAVSTNELFYRLDANGDLRLTPDEVRAVPALAVRFVELDADHDNGLTLTELSAFDPLQTPAKK